MLLDRLVELGLSPLEAEVYLLLLGREPSTGYRIGQLLGKPTANVYKAAEALARKGAVVIEEGESRTCRAVPPEEFLRVLEGSLRKKTREAAEALAQIRPAYEDERIYEVQSVDLVLERARTMLASATRVVLVDAFPEPLREIRPAIEAAAGRGVSVYVQMYAPAEVEGAYCVLAHSGERVLEHWASQQLNVVADGAEVLLALMDEGLTKVHQAAWSRSLYVANMLHAGLMREHVIHRLMAVKDQPDALAQMRGVLENQSFFHNSDVPGQRALLARFAARPEPAPAGRTGS